MRVWSLLSALGHGAHEVVRALGRLLEQAMQATMPDNPTFVLAWAQPRALARQARSWSQRYGLRHRLRRIMSFPAGIVAPLKVRVYFRAGHFVLQFWDPAVKRNLSDRVNGDLLSALSKAREIDQRLTAFRSSGLAARKLRHEELVTAFLADLEKRSDAGQIQPTSLRRYRSALTHYLAFVQQPSVAARCGSATAADRELALAFAAFLERRQVTRNGRGTGGNGHCAARMKGQRFVWDAVRAMYQWAADPDRGHLLPAGFRNPFLRSAGHVAKPRVQLFGQPDITLEMAGQLLRACDDYQLPIFTLLIFYGLRASEPLYLFGEYVERDWLRVPCNPDLSYVTKGKQDKQLPLLEPIGMILPKVKTGLLIVRRSVAEGKERPPLLGRSLSQLVGEFRSRLDDNGINSAIERHQLRDRVLRQAGALSYDQLDSEFRTLAAGLDWPASATLKDFRHLFASSLANAGMAEPYRQYLMGHATSSAAINAYTHLSKVQEQYRLVMQREFPPLLEALRQRTEVK